MIVDIVAPASSVSPLELKNSLKFLKELHLQPRLRGSLQKKSLFAQNEKTAFLNFKKALCAKDSALVWCLRGGYGSGRLLEHLDTINKKLLTQKLFIGHSDSTLLHDWIHTKLKWPTLHFPVLSHAYSTALSSQNQLKKILFGKAKEHCFSSLQWLNPQKKQWNTKIKSQITGGNLTMIQSAVGTPWEASRKKQFLFLEDIYEKPYEIHRALWQIKHSGIIKNTQAVIFGKWQEYKKSILQEALIPFAKSLDIPVLADLPCGHGRVNTPLPLLTPAELSFKKNQVVLKVPPPSLKGNR